jgi:hypothetical protein
MKNSFIPQLKLGLPTRGYFTSHGLEFYISNKQLLVNGKFFNFLTIGNIQTPEQGKGNYTEFLKFLEDNLPDIFYGICVESILEERFLQFHWNHKFEPANPPGALSMPMTVTKVINPNSKPFVRL